MSLLLVFNRQKTRSLDTAALRRLARHLLEKSLGHSQYELGVHVINASEMAKLNETFLDHEGSTDVITFNHHDGADHEDTSPNSLAPRSGERGSQASSPRPSPPQAEEREVGKLYGEIFISIDDAVAQAEQFHTTWQEEIVRYLAHGLLHLEGHDDLEPAARRTMKRQENKLVKELSASFDLGKLRRVKNVNKRR